MVNILVVRSSAAGAASVSNQLIDELLGDRADLAVVDRDLDRDPVPHVASAMLAGLGRAAPVEGADPAPSLAARALSDTLIAELKAADLLVIGAPMYNFGIASTLKAWFDHVLRAGETFAYTAAGPEGLLKGKRAIVIETRGSAYGDGPARALDSQEPHLRTLLGFIGITDLVFVRAERLAISPEARAAGIAEARATLAETPLPLAA